MTVGAVKGSRLETYGADTGYMCAQQWMREVTEMVESTVVLGSTAAVYSGDQAW